MQLLTNLWDDERAEALDPLSLLAYRSNLLGTDLRITNFGGGNTSSKLELRDPVTRRTTRVLAVKGSGGDLGTIRREGFALLDLERLESLEARYRGEEFEDEMAELYPMCAFPGSTAPPSIDTPLHALLPFPHIDHLHPDWAIALAASANARAKLAEFNERSQRNLVWVPWQRPGFELALMMRLAIEQKPQCDGLLLGSHGLFTWGETQKQCYESSLNTIDQLGQFVLEHDRRLSGKRFGGPRHAARSAPTDDAAAIFPYLRGCLAAQKRSIGHYDGSHEMIEFVNAVDSRKLAEMGTSCPDHFIRTRIRPMYVDWDTGTDLDALKLAIRREAEEYRQSYEAYYHRCAGPGSPPLRDPNPAVVLVPGIGMFAFGRTKTEARITAEFYVNARNVIQGATALGSGSPSEQGAMLPQAREAAIASRFASYTNYVALPPEEAFRIEYWSLEEAKLRRMPPEKDMARRIFLIDQAGTQLGRSVAGKMADFGAHLMLSGGDTAGAGEAVCATGLDGDAAVHAAVLQFGGLDGVVCGAGSTVLLESAARVIAEQGLPASLVVIGERPRIKLPPFARINCVSRHGGMIWSDTSEEVEPAAEVVCFLASDRSEAIRNHVLPLDVQISEKSE